MFAAVAAGRAQGGYDTIVEAAEHMAGLRDEVYRPIAQNKRRYDQLFAEYVRLHDYFGRGTNDAMKTLRRIRDEALAS
jgi:L-ribulokinase